MPIRPENKKFYPNNWKEIRLRILKRAKERCEFCGLKNHEVGCRDDKGRFFSFEECEKFMEEDFDLIELREKGIKIVLTIAHLNHNPQDNDPENLRALCQQCHNNLDKYHRARNRTRKSVPLFEG